jgi:hypothetical protein
VRIAGRRDFAIALVAVLAPACAEAEGRGKRARSSMKFPAARLEGVRGSSSFTVTSYGWSATSSRPTEAIPHGWPSLPKQKKS